MSVANRVSGGAGGKTGLYDLGLGHIRFGFTKQVWARKCGAEDSD